MKILKFLISLSLIFVTASCAKDEVDMTGDIYGKVTDAFSGEPLQSANVTLTPGGYSTTTGSNGTYEFKDLEQGEYDIQVSKAGYITNNKRVSVAIGGTVSGDVVLESEKMLQLDVSSLNFGKTITSLSFEIRNIGSTKCNWNISGIDDIDWLEFTPSTGTLEAGKSNAVKVLLLRDKLTENKVATILINGNKESVALKITAEVDAKTSKIALSSSILNFGKEYSALTFDIKNIGNAGNVNWDITNVDVDWITVSPKTGTTAMGKSSVVKVDLDRSKLTENSTTNIIVNCDGESLPVTINAEVKPARTWVAYPTRIDFDTNSESALTLYSYNGKTDYSLSVRGDASWLKLSKASGTIPEYSGGSAYETIALNVDRSGLSAGTYECVLVAQSDLGELQIPVTMKVVASNPDPGQTPSTTGEIISCDADLQFTLNSCTISGSTATITYKVKNIGSSDVVFGELRSPSSTSNSVIYDDLGNQYADATLTIGNSEGTSVRNTIPSGVSVNCSIKIKNVSEKASSFSTIKLYIYNVYTDIDEDYLYLNNVSIEGRSKYEEPTNSVSGKIETCDGDLDFKLTAVNVIGSSVEVSYKVTNIGTKDVQFGELRSPQITPNSLVYDDKGNQYSDVLLTIGTVSGNNVSVNIPVGASVNGKIKVKDVATDATEFSVIKLYIYNVYTGIDEQYLYLRNVKFK